MSAQENIDIVRQGYAAFSQGNIDGLLALLSEDIDWTVPALEGVPFTGKRRGRTEVAEFFKSLAAAEDISEFTQEDYIAEDDKVVVTGRSKARVKSTGRSADTAYVHIFTIRGGKIQKFVEHFDTAAVAEAYRQSAGAGA